MVSRALVRSGRDRIINVLSLFSTRTSSSSRFSILAVASRGKQSKLSQDWVPRCPLELLKALLWVESTRRIQWWQREGPKRATKAPSSHVKFPNFRLESSLQRAPAPFKRLSRQIWDDSLGLPQCAARSERSDRRVNVAGGRVCQFVALSRGMSQHKL